MSGFYQNEAETASRARIVAAELKSLFAEGEELLRVLRHMIRTDDTAQETMRAFASLQSIMRGNQESNP